MRSKLKNGKNLSNEEQKALEHYKFQEKWEENVKTYEQLRKAKDEEATRKKAAANAKKKEEAFNQRKQKELARTNLNNEGKQIIRNLYNTQPFQAVQKAQNIVKERRKRLARNFKIEELPPQNRPEFENLIKTVVTLANEKAFKERYTTAKNIANSLSKLNNEPGIKEVKSRNTISNVKPVKRLINKERANYMTFSVTAEKERIKLEKAIKNGVKSENKLINVSKETEKTNLYKKYLAAYKAARNKAEANAKARAERINERTARLEAVRGQLNKTAIQMIETLIAGNEDPTEAIAKAIKTKKQSLFTGSKSNIFNLNQTTILKNVNNPNISIENIDKKIKIAVNRHNRFEKSMTKLSKLGTQINVPILPREYEKYKNDPRVIKRIANLQVIIDKRKKAEAKAKAGPTYVRVQAKVNTGQKRPSSSRGLGRGGAPMVEMEEDAPTVQEDPEVKLKGDAFRRAQLAKQRFERQKAELKKGKP